MAFTKDICFKGKEEIERTNVVFPVGKKAWVQWAVYILPK
jgi:hypothetical protein